MKYNLLFLLFLLTITEIWSQDIRPVNLVDPYIDTGAPRARWFFFSSACRPFGMVNLSPDTNPEGDWGAGYLYDSEHIQCFSHIHAWEMGGIAVMPTVGKFQGHKGGEVYKSRFTHENEIVKPGYHKVQLDDYGIQAELTSTTRVGFHKYTFPKNQNSYILFDGGAQVGHGATIYSEAWKVNETDIAGYEIMEGIRRRPKETPVYFYARLNKPFERIITWKDGEIVKNGPIERVAGANSGLAIKFSTEEKEEVLLKVGISYVSVEQAKLNLESELDHWDFEEAQQNSYDEWNAWLSRIEIEGGSKEQKVKFYTDLWHALLGRRIVSDVNGKYMDRRGDYPIIRQVDLNKEGKPKFPHHNFDAWWGSHWSLNILWSMAYPKVMDAFCNTMVDIYKNGGTIPRGSTGGNYSYVMIGDPASSFFAAAYNKGIRNYDIDLAYEGLKKNAFPGGIRSRAGYEFGQNPSGGGMSLYIEKGYVPDGRSNLNGFHTHANASMTLEYAYQDWCLSQMALGIGEKEDYLNLKRRSQNYKNLWNPITGYIHPKDTSGNWIVDFDPLNLHGFCESNSAIYSYYVPHDILGLIELFGGTEEFVERLDSQFRISEPSGFCRIKNKRIDANWTDYCNQPGTAMAHMFNHAGSPWLTQYWVRKIKEEYSDVSPYGGYKGDEDQGLMGGLGVLMAIGLFDIEGGANVNPKYEITSPIFDKITIHLDSNYYDGDSFVIETENNSPENIYIQNAELNGDALNKFWFTHKEFSKGGRLKITLGKEPNKEWGVE
ncbi:GH92 family glycosyl hydrolase [Membranihabitans maritimus]|uniref:GH92 family glycosyl hydrolase n=1 Tax=Membranihabitans maritimus TaxID=2904244 RepID=UPI001F02498C|nr:GH92 family glycosyl hydrolase [Membranihabitans maritimus]